MKKEMKKDISGITVYGISFSELYSKFGVKKVPKRYLEIFKKMKKAMEIVYGKLCLISTSKFRAYLKKTRPLYRYFKSTDIIKAHNLGFCFDNKCYVFISDDGPEETEVTIMHEAMHLRFGAHPWPASCMQVGKDKEGKRNGRN